MSGSLKRAMAKRAGRVGRGGGHSPIQSRPRGKPSGTGNLEGAAGLLGGPRPRPSRGSGGVRPRSLLLKGSCFPAGLCRFRGVPGRSPPRAARGAGGPWEPRGRPFVLGWFVCLLCGLPFMLIRPALDLIDLRGGQLRPSRGNFSPCRLRRKERWYR